MTARTIYHVTTDDDPTRHELPPVNSLAEARSAVRHGIEEGTAALADQTVHVPYVIYAGDEVVDRGIRSIFPTGIPCSDSADGKHDWRPLRRDGDDEWSDPEPFTHVCIHCAGRYVLGRLDHPAAMTDHERPEDIRYLPADDESRAAAKSERALGEWYVQIADKDRFPLDADSREDANAKALAKALETLPACGSVTVKTVYGLYRNGKNLFTTVAEKHPEEPPCGTGGEHDWETFGDPHDPYHVRRCRKCSTQHVYSEAPHPHPYIDDNTVTHSYEQRPTA